MHFRAVMIAIAMAFTFFLVGLRAAHGDGTIEVRREIVNTLTNTRTVDAPLHFAYGASIDVSVDVPDLAEGSWTVLHIYDSVTLGSSSI